MSIEQAAQACFCTADEQGFVYHIKADFPAFNGHFKDYPVLPAVGQLALCTDAACRFFNKPVQLAAVKRAKFISPVQPGVSMRICFSARPDGLLAVQLSEDKTHKKISQLILQFTDKTQ